MDACWRSFAAHAYQPQIARSGSPQTESRSGWFGPISNSSEPSGRTKSFNTQKVELVTE